MVFFLHKRKKSIQESVFDLRQFQKGISECGQDIIEGCSERTDSLSRKKIVDLYYRCRQQQKLTPTAYKALRDKNRFVKLAALDLINTFASENSIQYLFKALEDEEDPIIRQRIVESIDHVESAIKKDYAIQPKIFESLSQIGH